MKLRGKAGIMLGNVVLGVNQEGLVIIESICCYDVE